MVVVHDYGTTPGGQQYVVMERLRGLSLKDVMQAEGVIEPLRATRLAEGIARGLSHAHENGLVHRDVKPSDVILVPDAHGERPVLLDFGLVKSNDSDEEVTKTGTFMGTPAYTAPEQARGEPNVDGRVDVYALGILLYRMLTGVLPYQGENPMATVILHITEPYPPMAKRNPAVSVDPGLEAIVRRAMAKSANERWDSAADMAAALNLWRDGTPVMAGPRQKSWVVPVIGGVGAVGALALVVGVLSVIAVGLMG